MKKIILITIGFVVLSFIFATITMAGIEPAPVEDLSRREMRVLHEQISSQCAEDYELSWKDFQAGFRECQFSKRAEQVKINKIANKCEVDKYHIYNRSYSTCIYNEEKHCLDENAWTYFDGSDCRINPMRQCLIDETYANYSWNTKTKKCNLDPIKVCLSTPDMAWDKVTQQCVFHQPTQDARIILECISNPGNNWDNETKSCVPASGGVIDISNAPE